ncbi:MAG: hypothetical protein N2246_00575 [Candidatus Sumerlaeia bacterium]|nr:hypothetical protein [Candidatus Sumerlaeia bacterium]
MRPVVTILTIILLLCCIGGCGDKRQKFSEETERDLAIINDRINDIDRQMQDLRRAVESMQNEMNLKMIEINNAILRLETSRLEAKSALENIQLRVKGEKKLSTAERKVLPIGVRIILVIIIIVLVVILIKKATIRPAGLSPGE